MAGPDEARLRELEGTKYVRDRKGELPPLLDAIRDGTADEFMERSWRQALKAERKVDRDG